MNKDDIKRYGVLVIGIILSLGFAFGAIQSFSSMVDAPAANQPGQQEEVEMPAERLTDAPFDLDPEQQHFLAVTESIIFVNMYYGTDEQREELEEIRDDLDEELGEKVYVAVVDEGENDILMTHMGVNEMPGYIVIGDNQGNPAAQGEGDFDSSEVAGGVCDTMASWDQFAGYCQSL